MKLLKNFSLYSIGRILVEGLKFFLIPIYTTYIPVAEFGLYSVLMTVKEVFLGFASQISKASYTRFFFKDSKEKSSLSSIVSIFMFSFGFFLILAILLSGVIKITIFESYPDLFYLFYVLIAIAFFQFFVTIFKRDLVMRGRAGRYFLTSIFVGIGPILLILYFILKQDMTVDGLFIGMLIPYVLLGSLAIILKSKQIFTRPKTSLMKRYLSFGSPLAFKTIAAKLIKGGDRIVIQTLLNSAAVGAYSFAYLITSALGMFLTKPFTSAVRPIIYKNEEKPKVLQKTVTNANQAILVSMSIVAIVFAFFIEYPLMMLVSNIEYLEYMPLVYLLSIAFVIQAAKTFTGTGIQLANKTMIIMWITMVAGATNIIFNLVLVSLYDVWGAAIATVLIHLLMLFANIHYSEKYHHLRYPRRRIMILIATYSAMMIGFYIFQGIIMDVVLKIALTLLYITLLWFFRILTKNNIMYAIRTIKKT